MKVNSDSVGLVTGGASGLGEGVARMLVGVGARVCVLDLPTSRGAELCAELGDGAMFVPVDIRDPAAVESAVEATVGAFGRIDLCVNCAGVPDAARVLDREGRMFPLDLYRKVVEVNLLGLFDVLRHAARAISRNQPSDDGERGVIVNVASIAGYDGQAGQAAYAASKGGVIAMTLPLARDLASLGIRVVTVCPGIFDTGMLAEADEKVRDRLADVHVFPERLGRPADFAQLVRAISENSMLNGEVIRLDAAGRLGHKRARSS